VENTRATDLAAALARHPAGKKRGVTGATRSRHAARIGHLALVPRSEASEQQIDPSESLTTAVVVSKFLDTTSSTYNGVVLHMVWTQLPTGCGGSTPMRCPFCRFADTRVVDSRDANEGDAIRRRRNCPECGKRFTTVEEISLVVAKRNGVTEPFSRSKVISGVRKACQGRPVDEDALALLAQKVEETIREAGAAEVPAFEVGLAILAPLRDLDEVAYLRFASVYRSFESLDDFEAEITALKAGKPEIYETGPPHLLVPAS
jgi:transcriptional repressor NrdR